MVGRSSGERTAYSFVRALTAKPLLASSRDGPERRMDMRKLSTFRLNVTVDVADCLWAIAFIIYLLT